MKRVEIAYCGDCPHRFYRENVLYCDEMDQPTTPNGGIPNWCPLPDAVNHRIPLNQYADRVVKELEGKSLDWRAGFRSALHMVAMVKI